MEIYPMGKRHLATLMAFLLCLSAVPLCLGQTTPPSSSDWQIVDIDTDTTFKTEVNCKCGATEAAKARE